MICPYCLQGEILEAKIKKTKELIKICDECDTVWNGSVSNLDGLNFDDFMKERKCEILWSELELIIN